MRPFVMNHTIYQHVRYQDAPATPLVRFLFLPLSQADGTAAFIRPVGRKAVLAVNRTSSIEEVIGRLNEHLIAVPPDKGV